VKTKILISISIKCYQDLLQHGAEEVLKREYGSYITETEQGYNFSILIDLTALPEDPGEFDMSTRGGLASFWELSKASQGCMNTAF
jgi:hypothetical protein